MVHGAAHPCCGGHTYHFDHCPTLADKFEVCAGCGHYRGEHEKHGNCRCIIVERGGERGCNCTTFKEKSVLSVREDKG